MSKDDHWWLKHVINEGIARHVGFFFLERIFFVHLITKGLHRDIFPHYFLKSSVFFFNFGWRCKFLYGVKSIRCLAMSAFKSLISLQSAGMYTAKTKIGLFKSVFCLSKVLEPRDFWSGFLNKFSRIHKFVINGSGNILLSCFLLWWTFDFMDEPGQQWNQ